ncbi:MAG: helix-turn-helix domain-containing protein [bacterium]|nr:helix-turn-helix domain-containing protein [bacterium]
MELKKVLENFGLTEKQAKVYLALLQLGMSSVTNIAEKADTKRPTTYLILEELKTMGLASKLSRKDNLVYIPESPEKILEEQTQKQAMIKNKLTELLALYNTKLEKPKVKFFQGEKAVRELYDVILKEKKIDLYGSISSIEKKLPGLAVAFADLIKKKEITAREILQTDEKSIAYAKRNLSPNHQIKIINKQNLFPTDNIIYGNKIAIFSYKAEPSAVVIEDDDVATTYKSMFEIVWNSIK